MKTNSLTCITLLLIFCETIIGTTTTYFQIALDPNRILPGNKTAIGFLFQSKTLQGFQRISIQKINGTSNDTITLTYSHGKPSVEPEFGSNVPPEIFFSNQTNFEDKSLYFYNGIWSRYFFDAELFKKTFSNEKNQFLLELGANFYTKPFKIVNGKPAYDTTTLNMEKVILKIDKTTTFTVQIMFWENYHPAIYSISLVLKIILFFLCALFSRIQPLKAHGLIPLTSMMILIIRLFVFFPYFLPSFFNFDIGTKIVISIHYSGIISILLLYPLNLSRFLLLVYLNHRKSIFQNEEKKKMKFHVQFLLILSHPITFPIFQLIFFIINTGIVYGFSLLQIGLGLIWYYVCIGIVAFVVSILMIIDSTILIFYFVKRIKNSKVKLSEKICFPLYFLRIVFFEDVLCFRTQIYILGLLFLLPPFLLLIFFYYLRIHPILVYTFSDLVEFQFLFFSCLFLTFVSIWNFVRNLGKKKKLMSDLENAFENEKLWNLFINFSELEFEIENVKCFEDIKKFEKLKSQETRSIQIEKIKNLYFDSNSELEVTELSFF